MDEILEVGEKLHIIERRYIENEPRRHFVGEIIKRTGNLIRLVGFVWILDAAKNEFIKKSEVRERVMVIGERLIINVLPKETDIEKVKYIEIESVGLVVTDEDLFELDINEFSAMR